MNPGDRYTYVHPGDTISAHWDGTIAAKFFGLSDPAVQKKLLLGFLQFSDAGGYETSMTGFPDRLFSNDLPNGDVNFLVMELPDQDMKKLVDGTGAGLPVFQNFAPDAVVRDIVSNPVASVYPGCAFRWKTTNAGVIQGFALAFSDDLSPQAKYSCKNDFLTRGFGIFSLATKYKMNPNVPGSGKGYEISLSDRSEIVLALSALRVCRQNVPDFDGECPYFVVNKILEYHGQLSWQSGE